MKAQVIIIAAFLLTAGLGLKAQAPQAFNYQAIVRDAAGEPIENTNISLRFTIRSGSPAGTAVYRESHNLTTDEFGLISLQVGTGTADIGSMEMVDWPAASHYLQVEQDLNGGSSYSDVGTLQLISVPYALHAQSAHIEKDNTLEGDGTTASPLKIAAQGANHNDVLLWDGSTWVPNNFCNTLDDAYNCHGPGLGRIINADEGALEIFATDFSRALQLNSDHNIINNPTSSIFNSGSGIGEYIEILGAAGQGEWIRSSSNDEGVLIEQLGNGNALVLRKVMPMTVGDGLVVSMSNAGVGINLAHDLASTGDAMRITQNGAGKSLLINQNIANTAVEVNQNANAPAGIFTQTINGIAPSLVVNGFNTATAIASTQFGLGDGIKSAISNAFNASEALDVTTSGTGKTALITQTNPANMANVLEVVNSGNGVVAEFNQTKAGAPSPTIHAATSGMGSVAVFNQMNGANGAMTIAATNVGTGHVMKLDQLNLASVSPALVVTHAGKGSAARLEATKADNAEPTLDILNSGSGHAAYINSTLAVNTAKALKVTAANAGGALHIEGKNGFGATTAVIESSPASGAATRVLHVDQVDPFAFAWDEAVLISTNSTNAMKPALKVTTPSVTRFAAEFNGKVDVTGALTTGGAATVGGQLDVVGIAVIAGGINTDDILADVVIANTITAGVKMFRIDHPLYPNEKYLQHACIESHEALNTYSGNVLLNAQGEAIVELPEWFEALNTDCRYHLTTIGGFAPVYIKQKVNDNRFVIAGGTSGLEVSWQITGKRHDKFITDNPLAVEVEKAKLSGTTSPK